MKLIQKKKWMGIIIIKSKAEELPQTLTLHLFHSNL